MKNYCSYTGKEIEGSSDAIWDDGEWISWEYIDQFVGSSETPPPVFEDFPEDYEKIDELSDIFDHLIDSARRYKEITGRYLSIWGELGEYYAELQYGISRFKPYAQGADGRVGNDHVEIKTISPEKEKKGIKVKRTGHFNVLIVVKISPNFEFESRWVERKNLKKGQGKEASLSWNTIK